MTIELRLPTDLEEIRRIVLAYIQGSPEVVTWVDEGLLRHSLIDRVHQALYLSKLHSGNKREVAEAVLDILRDVTLQEVVKDKEKREQLEKMFTEASRLLPVWIHDVRKEGSS